MQPLLTLLPLYPVGQEPLCKPPAPSLPLLPPPLLWGLWHHQPLVPGCRLMPGHCCPLSWCALRVAATRTAPRPGHPAPPGIQGWHEATCRSQSTPAAFPSPLPHDTGSTRPRGRILHRDNRRTAPQPQALRPSSSSPTRPSTSGATSSASCSSSRWASTT